MCSSPLLFLDDAVLAAAAVFPRDRALLALDPSTLDRPRIVDDLPAGYARWQVGTSTRVLHCCRGGVVRMSVCHSAGPGGVGTEDRDAVVACRKAAQERLDGPDVDGMGATVERVRVGDREYGRYVEGVASGAGDLSATDLSCRAALF